MFIVKEKKSYSFLLYETYCRIGSMWFSFAVFYISVISSGSESSVSGILRRALFISFLKDFFDNFLY